MHCLDLVLAPRWHYNSKRSVIISKDKKDSVKILQGKVLIPREKGGKNCHLHTADEELKH